MSGWSSDEEARTQFKSNKTLQRTMAQAEKAHVDADAAKEWDAFPDLPGTHLSWRRSHGKVRELVSADGRVWAKVRPPVASGRSWVSVGSRTYTVKRVIDEDRALYLLPVARHFLNIAYHFDLVDERSKPVLSWQGRHFDHQAGTRVTLSDRTTYRFPVRGQIAKAIMSAVATEGGRPLIRYRLLNAWNPPILSQHTTNRWDYSVEVVVGPEARY